MMNWVLAYFTASAVPLLYGMEVGATSDLMRLIAEKRVMPEGDDWMMELNALQFGLITSSALLGAVMGGLFVIWLADHLGRRKELIVAGVFLCFGSLTTILSVGLKGMILGRVALGVGEGIGMHGALVYVGEIVPSHWRGVCGGSVEVLWVFGLLCSFVTGMFTSSWRTAFVHIFAISVPFMIGTFFLPESPRWIMLTHRSGGLHHAASAFELLGREEEESINLSHDILDMMRGQEEVSLFSTQETDQDKSIIWKPLLVGVVVVLLQQFTGQPSILYYLGDIFGMINIGPWGSVLVAGMKTIMTAIAVTQIDRLGRRILLMVGISTMACSLISLAFLYAFKPIHYEYGVVTFMITYVTGYQIGFGPVTWLLLSEIFPLQYKASMASICTLTNFVGNWVVLFFFEIERDLVGEVALFGQYALVAVIALIFVYKKVPETKGLDLEDITRLFQQSS